MFARRIKYVDLSSMFSVRSGLLTETDIRRMSTIADEQRVQRPVEHSVDTITDTFGRVHTYLHISLTESCNLRYIHNVQKPKSRSSPIGTFFNNQSFNQLKSKYSINNQMILPALLASVSTASQQYRLFSVSSHLRNSGNNKSSKELSHTDASGKARVVVINDKGITERIAVASATVNVGPEIAKLIEQNSVRKGDVLSIAQIAGIIGAKRTSEIMPMCHNISLSSVVVNTVLNLTDNSVNIRARVKCGGETGVEMEALCAVTTAAMTIYDMCKAISKHITITDIMLLKKSGGKQSFQREGYVDVQEKGSTDNNEKIVIQNYNTEPIVTNEPFYPTHI